jgi:cytochrome c biogenesis protein
MTSTDTKKENNPIWRGLASVKLTLTLLIILAVVSVFGTLIPQQEGAMDLAQRLSPRLVSFLNSLQLFDLYHSVWFRLIIGLLALNLIVCSIDRFPASLKLYRASPQPDRDKPYENLPSHRVLSTKGELSAVSGQVASSLKGKYRKVEHKETDKGHFVSAEKGKSSYFSVYMVHFSVLLILIGGILGSFFGFEGFVNIPEGETVDTVISRQSGAPVKLPFEVRCDRFLVAFYDNGAPKEYRSDLSFISQGKVATQGALIVNDPITFMGISFYQSTYGTIPGKKVQLRIAKVNSTENKSLEVEVGRAEELPGGSAQFQVTDVRSDFMRLGPAAHVAVKPSEGEEVHFWVFQNQEMIRQRFPGILEQFPKLNPRAFEPYAFMLEKVEAKYYTGLQVNRDPGVLLVYLGFCFMILGLFTTFFVPHRRVWVRIAKSKNKVTVSVTGRANRDHAALEKELDDLAAKMKEKLP